MGTGKKKCVQNEKLILLINTMKTVSPKMKVTKWTPSTINTRKPYEASCNPTFNTSCKEKTLKASQIKRGILYCGQR